jgi:hypothetical protein
MMLLMLITSVLVGSSRSTTVRNGAYHNIVIDILKDVPVEDCSEILLRLEVRIKA